MYTIQYSYLLKTLCTYLDHAEERELTIKQEKGVSKPLKQSMKKRRREDTPPELLQSD
jgi:hypothetical protein